MTISVYPEYPFQSHFHTIGSHRLHYLDEGQGPVIIMVHGNPTWSFYYRRLITLLSRENRVIAIDHLGCGLSDKPQGYDYCLQNHINNLSSLVHQLDITSYSLVVHDWGGAIGMGLAAENPLAVEKVMVLNTAAFRSQRIPFRISVCRWPLIGEFLVRALNGFAGPAVFMAVRKKMPREIADAYLAPYDSWKNRVAVAAFVKDIPLSPTHPSYQTLVRVEQGLEILQELKPPMMICWGGRDFCFNNHFYDEWCRRFPEAENHYFTDSGHYILEDAFGEIAPLGQKFFHHSNQS